MAGFCGLNLKFPLILACLVFISSITFMLSWVEHEISFITLDLGPFEPNHK